MSIPSPLAALPKKVREDLTKGLSSATPTQLAPPLRLYRFTDSAKGIQGAVSPWWMLEEDYLRIVTASELSERRARETGNRGLSLGTFARIAVAIPQEWQNLEEGTRTRTSVDLLLQASLRTPVEAYVGRGRKQREVSPNGIEVVWGAFSKVTQIYIPSFSQENTPRPSLQDIERVLALEAPRQVRSTPLYDGT